MKENKLRLRILKGTIKNASLDEKLIKKLKEDCNLKSGIARVVMKDFNIWYSAQEDAAKEIQ